MKKRIIYIYLASIVIIVPFYLIGWFFITYIMTNLIFLINVYPLVWLLGLWGTICVIGIILLVKHIIRYIKTGYFFYNNSCGD